MGFNLGAFAGGLVSGGLKTYTTLKEQERADAAEARDKERFEEEQRKIELGRKAEALQRKATIPTTGGIPVNDVLGAIPQRALFAGAEGGLPVEGTDVGAYEQQFRDTVKGLTPEQQALVLRGYGDTSNTAGQLVQKSQADANNPEALQGLSKANVREGADGERLVTTYRPEEKEVVARYKQLAMESGNPVAIKAANEAEATMLNRQVAEQSLKVGQQNIDLNVIKLSEAKDAQEFKTRFNTELTTVTKENNDLLLSIDKASKDPSITLESLVKTYGGKIKDITGDNLLVENGVVYTKDAGGTKTVLANSKEQAIDLLKTNAGQYFAKNLSNRLVSNGLFKDADAFNTFYAAERKYVMDAAGLVNSRVIAAAAASNAASAAVSAGAAKKKADTDATELEAKKEAGTFTAAADASRAAAGASRSQVNYHSAMVKAANDKASMDKDTREAMNLELAKYDALSDADKLGPKGMAVLMQAGVAGARKSGEVATLLNSMISSQKQGSDAEWSAIEKTMYANSTPQPEIAAARVAFFASRGVAPPAAAQAVLLGKGPDGKPLTEADVDSYNAQFPGSKVDKAALPWLKTAAAATTTPAAAIDTAPAAQKSELPRGTLQSTDGGKTYTLNVPDTIRDPKVKYYKPVPNPAAATLNNKSFKSAAEAEAAYNAAVEVAKKELAVPAAPAAQAIPTAAAAPAALTGEAKSAELRRKREESAAAALTAVERRKREESAAAVAAKDKAAPAEKSVRAREEDLSYKVIVAQSTYDRRPNAITNKQLESAQQELAVFRKANGIK